MVSPLSHPICYICAVGQIVQEFVKVAIIIKKKKFPHQNILNIPTEKVSFVVTRFVSVHKWERRSQSNSFGVFTNSYFHISSFPLFYRMLKTPNIYIIAEVLIVYRSLQIQKGNSRLFCSYKLV